MSVYIKGMEMPKEGFVEVLIRADGTVQQTGQSRRIDGSDYYTPYIGETPIVYSAISVPPHGRLIDADTLCEGRVSNDNVVICVKAAPTIIPAEEVQDD